MSHTMRLLIPLSLAVAAAVVNYLAIKSATRPVEFVQVTRSLKAGESFSHANLAKLELPAGFKELEKTAIPFKDRGVLEGKPAPRSFQAGDIVFQRDAIEGVVERLLEKDEVIVPVLLERNVEVVPEMLKNGYRLRLGISLTEAPSELKWIGPYRIVNLDPRHAVEVSGSQSATTRMISVAVDPQSASGRGIEEFLNAKSLEKATLRRVQHFLPEKDEKDVRRFATQ